MQTFNVIPMRRAKRTLSQLVRLAAAGQTVLIGLNGHAMAKLTSFDAAVAPRRRLGFLKGRLIVPEDVDTPLPDDVLKDFEGEC